MLDELLTQLRQEILDEEVDATAFAALWIGVGLRIAAQIVEDKRIAILCDLIAMDIE